MRPTCARYVRSDMVELLLCKGRLGDIQMSTFFANQLSKLYQGREQTVSGGDTASGEIAARSAIVGSLQGRVEVVERLARTRGPLAWVGKAYGEETWSSSYLSHRTVTGVTDVASGNVKLTGHAVAVGDPSSTPTSVTLAADVDGAGAEGNGSHPNVVAVTVLLNQSGVTSTAVNGSLNVRLEDAKATLKPTSAEGMAVEQHVLTAAAYSGMLAKLEEVCSLHATSTVRYDGLLIRNPAVQMRLSQLACFRFGVMALSDFVVGDSTETESGARHGRTALTPAAAEHEVPLMESLALSMYAESAMLDGMDAAWEMVRGTPLHTARPHRSNADKMIDYPYVEKLLDTSKYALTAVKGSMEAQAMAYLGPLLEQTTVGPAGGIKWGQKLLGSLVGMSGGHVRLAAPHVNIKVSAAALEEDIAKLLDVIAHQKNRSSPPFVMMVGSYVSELLANLAVLYRCTASLETDEDGRGHRELLLTQAFCAASSSRRRKVLHDFQLAHGASRTLRHAVDLDNYSTHPVELMNAPPRRGGDGSTATAAEAK